MSVGDFVYFNGQWKQVLGCGWKDVSDEYVSNWFSDLVNLQFERDARCRNPHTLWEDVEKVKRIYKVN